MTASVSRPCQHRARRASSWPGRSVLVAEPLAGDLADAPSARGHARPALPGCDLSSRRMATTASRTAEDRKERLAQQRRTLPDGPGVYLFRDAKGRVIYVGKAKSISRPRHVALLEQPPRDGQRDRPHRVRARLQRGGGAARGAELHQAVQAALQRPAARRQVLSVHRHLDGRGVPARLLHTRAPPPRPSLLRPVLQREARPRHARPPREDLPVPLLQRRRAGPAQRLAVPGLLHQALRGALRRLRLARRSTARRSTRSSRSSRAATARSSATSSGA